MSLSSGAVGFLTLTDCSGVPAVMSVMQGGLGISQWSSPQRGTDENTPGSDALLQVGRVDTAAIGKRLGLSSSEAACFWGTGRVVTMQHACRVSAARKKKAGPCRGTTQPDQANGKGNKQNKTTEPSLVFPSYQNVLTLPWPEGERH